MTLEAVARYWDQNPVGDALITTRATVYDYLRAFDNLREAADCEPYEYSNVIHGYETSAGLRVLDYGCGNGYVLAHYARHGAQVVGVDIAAAATRLSRLRFDLLGLRGHFLRNDGIRLPLASESFDLVCSMGVLHHVEDAKPLVAELHRVLRAGGKLVVMVYHRGSFRYNVTYRWRRYFGGRVYRGRSRDEQARLNDGAENPYGRVYSREELRELLGAFERHEFRVNKLAPQELALWNPVLMRVVTRVVPRRAVDALARRYGWNLYCVARKR